MWTVNIYIYNFFLTLFYRCVNCYGLVIAGADELKNWSQWLNVSMSYLIWLMYDLCMTYVCYFDSFPSLYTINKSLNCFSKWDWLLPEKELRNMKNLNDKRFLIFWRVLYWLCYVTAFLTTPFQYLWWSFSVRNDNSFSGKKSSIVVVQLDSKYTSEMFITSILNKAAYAIRKL